MFKSLFRSSIAACCLGLAIASTNASAQMRWDKPYITFLGLVPGPLTYAACNGPTPDGAHTPFVLVDRKDGKGWYIIQIGHPQPNLLMWWEKMDSPEGYGLETSSTWMFETYGKRVEAVLTRLPKHRMADFNFADAIREAQHVSC